MLVKVAVALMPFWIPFVVSDHRLNSGGMNLYFSDLSLRDKLLLEGYLEVHERLCDIKQV